jgi:hypothetical protein
MQSLGGDWSEFHRKEWVSYRHLISLGEEGEILIEKSNYHTKVICTPKNGMPRLFKLVIHALREAGLSVDSYVYTKATDIVEVVV